MTSYTERELTAPLKTLRKGETLTLVTSLQLHRLEQNRPLEPQISRILGA